ncbi:MAG: sugar-binding protein, partial [Armatimonadota bacterium]
RLKGVASRRHQEEQVEKSLQAVRASQPVNIDGRLDEAVWRVSYNGTGALWWTWRREAAMRAEAGSVEEFERMPPPSYANAQFAWDASGLYLAVAANHSTLENSLCEHDTDDPGLWQDDCMEFFFQIAPSQSHYYHLIVNVRGARTLLSRNDLVSSQGIEVAQVSPVNDSGGYHQEIFVPWRRLGLDEPPHAGDVWRLQVGREFHSWNHITCWAQVNAQFAEQERWGVMMFGGEPGPVAITRLDLGARFPGRNRLQAALRATGEEAPGPVEARLLDQSGNPVATETLSLQAGAGADLALSYEIDPARLPGQPVEWRLVVVGDAGEELTSVPVPIPHVTRALGIEDCPGSAWSGQVIPIDLTVRLGDLSAPGQRLLGRLRSVAGGTVSLPSARLAAGVRQRTWLDTGGLQPGRWRLELWADTGEPRPATATLEILPCPVAERP